MKRMTTFLGTALLLAATVAAPSLAATPAGAASYQPAGAGTPLSIALLLPDADSGQGRLQSFPEGSIEVDGGTIRPFFQDAAANTCDAAMMRCYSNCSRMPVYQDECYHTCDVNFVNCQ